MNRRKKLKSISIKSFITTELSRANLGNVAGGVHPGCPTDGGPETFEGEGICYDLSTTPNKTCPIIM